MKKLPPLPDRFLFAGLVVLLAWIALPHGSTSLAAASLLGLACALLAAGRWALALYGMPLPPLPRAARAAVRLWWLWLAWLGLQLVPLPAGVVAWLSPQAYAAHVALATIPGATPAFTLSVQPGSTAQQWILSASYFALFWLVLVSTARNRSRQRAMLLTLVLCGMGQALYGALMTLSGLEYGFFEHKSFGVGVATGTFVNRNHFAGYLELTMSAGIALILADLRGRGASSWKERLAGWVELAMSGRLRIRVMLVVMVIALVLTRSRGGNIALFSALALCGAAYVFLRHRAYFLKSLLFFVSLIAVDLLIVSQHYGLQAVAARIQATDVDTEQRMIAFHDLQPMLAQYWPIGSGAGSFATAFSPYQSTDLHGFFNHAHNDHLEFLVETGIWGYGILAALAGLVTVHALLLIRRRRDPMPAALGFAAMMGLAALLLHGLFDFNLHIPAVAATLVALLALPLGCSSRSRRATVAPDDAPLAARGE